MEFYAFHGCLDEERRDGNRFCVDIEFEYDMRKAAVTDDVHHAVDYSSVYDLVKQQMAKPSNLLENVAWRILTSIRQSFPAIGGALVTVTKFNPPVGGKVEKSSVTMSF